VVGRKSKILMSILIVTGTGTDIGKTFATAAIAALAPGRVAVVKPAQTGMAPDDAGDLAEITRLSGVTDVHEYARYPDPLSPHHAARVSGLPELVFADVVRRIVDLDATHDLVLIEGAGGLQVPFDNEDRWTLMDLAGALNADFVVVTEPGLGTLNHTKLTVDLIEEQTVVTPHIVIGRWPAEPDLAMRCNVADLRRMGRRSALGGALPDGMATMRDFPKQARAALGPELGGNFDSRAFVARHMA
jgi:dethiobiotin synthetase